MDNDLGWLCALGEQGMEAMSNDLGYLCAWGGHRLPPWEYVGLHPNDQVVVECVDYWMWKEAVHVRFSDTLWHTQDPMQFLLFEQDVQEVRAWSDRARELGLDFASLRSRIPEILELFCSMKAAN